ncbi:MAG: MFS transporter, partial [Solirubrobacterales bacterium]|nr:MFS transporter [Solirubrobacterales bacterium]
LGDRTDRRALASLSAVGLGLISGALAFQAAAHLDLLWPLYVLAALHAGLAAISGPLRRTFIPSLLPVEQLTAGMSLNRLSFQLMLTLGPALAGLIAADPGLGLPGCYLIDAVSFAASLYGLARLPDVTVPTPHAAHPAGTRRGPALHPAQRQPRRCVPGRSDRHRVRPPHRLVSRDQRPALRRRSPHARIVRHRDRRRRTAHRDSLRSAEPRRAPGRGNARLARRLGSRVRRLRRRPRTRSHARDARDRRRRRQHHRRTARNDHPDQHTGSAARTHHRRRIRRRR